MPITYGPPDKKKDIKIEVPPGQMTLTTSPPEVTIYEATASATSEVTVQLAIKGLQPIFEKMDDLELYVMAHDDEPIGPRVNVKDVPDKAAKFIALYELQKREDEKKDEKQDWYKRMDWRIAISGILIGVIGVIIAIVK